jgi:uncharacterized protein
MKAVITGGTGLIGLALAESLLDEGYEVIILSRNPQASAHIPTGAVVAEWDAHTEKGWVEHASGADAIINLAGAPLDTRWTPAYKKRILESRLQATEAVVAAVKKAKVKPKVLVQASAVGYYGARGDETITEDTPAGEGFLADVCKQWETSSAGVEKEGVRRVITRTGLLLSTKSGPLARILPVFKMFIGGPVGLGKHYYPWIHIGDEIDAIRFLIENPKASGVFNLTAPSPVTNREFSKTLGKVINRPAFTPAPPPVLKVMFGELSSLVLTGQRVIPQNLLKLGYEFRFADLETAFRHLLYSGVNA